MALKLANLAKSTLASSITSDATAIFIQNSDAGKFPALAANDWHPATIIDSAGNNEVVRVTARNAATLTVVRAQENTTAKAFAAGSRIDIRLTAGALSELTTLVAAVSAAVAQKADMTAVTALVADQIADLVDSSPATLDTLKELAAALGNDPNFSTTMLNALAGKVSRNGGDSMKAPLSLDGASGVEKMLRLTTGGLDRWKIGAVLDAESGDNEGSDLGFFRFNDDGTYVDGPVRIGRKTGITTVDNVRLGNKASAADIAAGVLDKFPDARAVRDRLAALPSFGNGQVFSRPSPLPVATTIRQNTSPRAIFINGDISFGGNVSYFRVGNDGVNWIDYFWGFSQNGSGGGYHVTVVIPTGAWYYCTNGSWATYYTEVS